MNSIITDQYELIHGDAIVEMGAMENAGVDLVLCDMPYGTTQCNWDTVLDLQRVWEQLVRVTKDDCAILLFAQTPFDKVLGCSNLNMLRYEWIWEKTKATGHFNAKKMPMKSHENILVFYKKLPTYNPIKTTGHRPCNHYIKTIESANSTNVYGKSNKVVKGGGETTRYPRSVQKFSSDTQKSKLHPTQKPVQLLKYFIETYSEPGDTVLDYCMGSGSTGEACLLSDRYFIGIDNDESYVETANNRLSSFEMVR